MGVTQITGNFHSIAEPNKDYTVLSICVGGLSVYFDNFGKCHQIEGKIHQAGVLSINTSNG